MKHHVFSPAAAVATAAMAILLLACGSATGAMAAVTSTSAPSARQTTATVPGAPVGLKASNDGGFIALSWSPPTSTGGAPVTGYHVYLGHSRSLVDASVFDASGTTFRATDVELGSPYYIRVTALNAAGEGSPTPVTSVTPLAPDVPRPGPSRPTGLTAQARHGAVVLSWSPPQGGLKASDGYLIYIGASPGHEGAKPSIHYLIHATSYRIAPLKRGTRYYFQVALLDRANRMSARSAEVSAVPRGGAGSAPVAAAGSSAGAGAPAGSGAGAAAQPGASPLPGSELAQDRTPSSLPAGVVVLLVALALAAGAGVTTAIVLLQRRRYDRGYGPAPAPRRPYDDQPTWQHRHTEEMNGPRYR